MAYQLRLPANLRPKQKAVIEAFLTRSRVTVKLPTGYGKTLTAAGAYAALHSRQAADRILYVVAKRPQAEQAAEDIPEALTAFGINSKSMIVGDLDNPTLALRAHKNNEIQIFVVTVQSLLHHKTRKAVAQLMQTHNWFLVVDEYHHYGTDGDGVTTWTKCLEGLNPGSLLAMSATPNRTDGSDYFRDPDPELSETYVNAMKCGYLKALSLHAYEYAIDVVTVDGVMRLTTSELAIEAGGASPDQIDTFLSGRAMRFNPDYVSPLVMIPTERMIDLRARGIKSQMLVQAMSCEHAKCIVEQVSHLIPDGMRIDWVGTGANGRSTRDNHRILEEFCPRKDKVTRRRRWTLDILVNVNMATEGLDTIDVTEISFLKLVYDTITNRQNIGRGGRPMNSEIRPPCHINVDTSSPVSAFIGPRIMQLFDLEVGAEPLEEEFENEHDDTGDGYGGDYEELPDTLICPVISVRLVDIKSEPGFQFVMKNTKDHFREQGQTVSQDEIESVATRFFNEYLNQSNNKNAIFVQKRDQINAAVRKLSGLIIKVLTANGNRIERTLAGVICREINKQKWYDCRAIDEADEDSLERHYQWIKRLENAILKDGVNGIPEWLYAHLKTAGLYGFGLGNPSQTMA